MRCTWHNGLGHIPTISPSEQTEMNDDEDDEENQQELGNVYTTTTMRRMNLPTEELGVQLLKLMWGECVEA